MICLLLSNFYSVLCLWEFDYLLTDAEDKVARKAYYNRIKMQYIEAKNFDAAMLYFLMKTSFNGWWKVYNFAQGRYSTCRGTLTEKKPFINYKLLKETSKFFKERVIDIMSVDFSKVYFERGPNTYVYCDPPYRESYGYEYQAGEFNDDDQKRLCEFMLKCHDEGCAVSMSNREVGDGFWKEQIPDMEVLLFDAQYTAAHGPTTIDAQEVLIRNFKSEQSALEALF